MKFSRGARITTLLVIDVIFFFIELIVGYAIGSLALVADSFHMLNDVISLVVALYAIQLMKNKANAKYSYGWHRAEILAALVNGVFLLALCFSIFLEAIERFFSTPDISNPMLVVIVGSCGLLSNFVGFLLFNEHGGHSHGEEGGHDHDHAGHDHASHSHDTAPTTITERTPLMSYDGVAIAPRPRTNSVTSSIYAHPAAARAAVIEEAEEMALARAKSPERERRSSSVNAMSPPSARRQWKSTTLHEEDEHHHAEGEEHEHEHAEAEGANGNGNGKPAEHENGHGHGHDHSHSHGHSHSHEEAVADDVEANAHDHAAFASLRGGGGGGHGHSHGNMNMRALVLHVLGDALGNIGVIMVGLIIWLTDIPGKYYCDPIISLVITCIIFSSAMPLVRSASFILLQAVPQDISLEDVRDAVLNVPGVLAIHELHVWQLSESKVVASVHVWVSKTKDYMGVALAIRRAFHDHGIHSCTIQPEFHDGTQPEHRLTTAEETACLIACGEGEACDQNNCCPPIAAPAAKPSKDDTEADHDHANDHEHEHEHEH